MSASTLSPGSLWHTLVLAARPKTLWLALSPVVLGTAAAAAESRVRLWVACMAALGAVAIQVGTNFVNDWADGARGADAGERLGPVRMTASGRLLPHHGQKATLAAFLLATLAGASLVWQGGWPVVVVGLSGLLAGWAYTAGPFPLAYHGLGELFAFVYFGPVAVLTTAYLHTDRWVPSGGPLGVSMGALAALLLAINNLRDRVGDAKVKKYTLAVRLGSRGARAMALGWLSLAFIAPVQGVSVGLLPRGCVAIVLLLPWMGWLGVAIARREGRALNALLPATSGLQLVLALLLSAVLVGSG